MNSVYDCHEDLRKAIEEKDYETICELLHTRHFESDSDYTVSRCNTSFTQGYQTAEKIFRADAR